MYNLKNKICIIAGASSGIGRETALVFAKNGATVICTARRTELLLETVEEIKAFGGVAEAYSCDFTNPENVEALSTYVISRYSQVDIWINGVGVNNAMGITWDLSYDDWFNDLNGNLRTCYIGTKCAINAMKHQGFGCIINLSGGGVTKPEVYNSAYACSKTALVRFTECINLELQKENIPISIFAFNPGLITTERTLTLIEKKETLRFMPAIIDPIKNGETLPISVPAEYMAYIATGRLDFLSGCLLDSYINQEELLQNKEQILSQQLYKIQVKGCD